MSENSDIINGRPLVLLFLVLTSILYLLQIKTAADHLSKGEVIATPTDTIYGLAALANNTKAVTKIYDIKGEISFDFVLFYNKPTDLFARFQNAIF